MFDQHLFCQILDSEKLNLTINVIILYNINQT